MVSDPNDGCPHLVKAARQGTTALVDFLLETGADLEESDRLKCKPIYIANMRLFSQVWEHRLDGSRLQWSPASCSKVDQSRRERCSKLSGWQLNVSAHLHNVVDNDDDGLATHSHHYK